MLTGGLLRYMGTLAMKIEVRGYVGWEGSLKCMGTLAGSLRYVGTGRERSLKYVGTLAGWRVTQTSQVSLFDSETHCFRLHLKVSLSHTQISLDEGLNTQVRRAKDINFTIVTKSLILSEYHMMYIDHAAYFSV